MSDEGPKAGQVYTATDGAPQWVDPPAETVWVIYRPYGDEVLRAYRTEAAAREVFSLVERASRGADDTYSLAEVPLS